MADNYYEERLFAERLERCYELALPLVQRYLDAEIQHVLQAIHPGDRVLELGCGYGRVLARLAPATALLVGIDTARASLGLALRYLPDRSHVFLAQMNALYLGFAPASFDLVCCVQNGISAFHVDQRALLQEALRVTRPGGKVQFFSYAEEFWPARLEWFRLQAAHGLLGEIDEEATGEGTIVCRDGFRATTVGPTRFAELAAGLGRVVSITTIERASVVCEIEV